MDRPNYFERGGLTSASMVRPSYTHKPFNYGTHTHTHTHTHLADCESIEVL